MWGPAKLAVLLLVIAPVFSVVSARQMPESAANASSARRRASESRKTKKERMLTEDDGLAVIAAALDARVRRYAGSDCSHLVHAIYQRAGFPYTYVNSNDLYAGVEGFERVSQPQPGDLIVWRGHVGIVVRPSRHVFFSFKSVGPGIDDYTTPYWSGRGVPRFFRYIKNDPCAGCSVVSHRASPN